MLLYRSLRYFLIVTEENLFFLLHGKNSALERMFFRNSKGLCLIFNYAFYLDILYLDIAKVSLYGNYKAFANQRNDSKIRLPCIMENYQYCLCIEENV